jgi:hypothetical protein
MMKMRFPSFRAAMLTLLVTGLAACTTVPPVTADAEMCNFHKRELRVDEPPQQLLHAFAAPATAFARAPGVAPPPPPDNAMLFLSGGSQHGAFGAGLLRQWADQAGGRFPRFKLVTGISTGALIATAAFLQDPDLAVRAYDIRDESEVLRPYVKMRDGDIATLSYPSVLRHNAAADLTPLRARLHDVYLPFERIRDVAEQSNGRTMLVGVVDVDAGAAVSLDLTAMARDAVQAMDIDHDDKAAERLHYCYIDAIIASSSAPLAAPPIFIDNRMYIDGGARFGAFSQDFGSAAGLPLTPDPNAPLADEAPELYVIVNGTQETSPECGKLQRKPGHPALGEGICLGGIDDIENLHGAHKPWDLLSLAMRTADGLANQVYRFSVADIHARYIAAYPNADKEKKWHYARIMRDDMLAHGWPSPATTCQYWHDKDKAELRPVQFYPNYMRCVTDYGKARAIGLKWGSTDALSDPL